jgi:hypothetical protein
MNFESRRRAIAGLRPDIAMTAFRPGGAGIDRLEVSPESSDQPQQPAPPTSPPEPASSPPAPAPPQQVPMPTPPQAPPANPFADLAFPSPGDRIKADDFRRLSQALRILSDTYALSGAAFGFPFGQVKLALTSQQYEIAHVVSVYGTELMSLGDPSLDDRKVLAVTPLVLGDRRVSVVVTEQAAAATRPTMIDLTGATYSQAQARLQSELRDVLTGGPITAPDLAGMTVNEAMQRMSG